MRSIPNILLQSLCLTLLSQILPLTGDMRWLTAEVSLNQLQP